MTGFSRRSLLGGAAALVGAAASGVAVGRTTDSSSSAPSAAAAAVAFRGRHQAGIGTPAQDRLAFAAFDVTTQNRDDLRAMLREWTAAAEAMYQGKLVPGGEDNLALPPADTGEAVGLPPSQLSVTIGFGPSLFDQRFELAARKPARLAQLPALPGDELQPQRSGGDIAIQACSEDPQVAFHVVRNLARLARGVAVLRWTQLGFGRTSSTGSGQTTPRNLMGFKDGTRNIRGDDTATMNTHVWVGDEEPQAWLRGGSYLVTRRIRMLIEAWDRDFLADQQNVFGRHKQSGAPLTGRREFDTPNLAARTAVGQYVIPPNAHIRLANRATNGGIQILRRGYSYTDGIDPDTGELDAGLFFICYQRDPAQFVTLQRKLGAHDALNEYIQHTSSAVFACPPGLLTGQHWGDSLFHVPLGP